MPAYVLFLVLTPSGSLICRIQSEQNECSLCKGSVALSFVGSWWWFTGV